jgi:hypothetical protein
MNNDNEPAPTVGRRHFLWNAAIAAGAVAIGGGAAVADTGQPLLVPERLRTCNDA